MEFFILQMSVMRLKLNLETSQKYCTTNFKTELTSLEIRKFEKLRSQYQQVKLKYKINTVISFNFKIN